MLVFPKADIVREYNRIKNELTEKPSVSPPLRAIGTPKIEVETRFGTFELKALPTGPRGQKTVDIEFKSSTTFENFVRLQEKYAPYACPNNPLVTTDESGESTDKRGNIRKTTTEVGNVSWSKKERQKLEKKLDNAEYGVRIDLNVETPIAAIHPLPTPMKGQPAPQGFFFKNRRVKRRYSYILDGGRLDLTAVDNENLIDRTASKTYEVEFELTDPTKTKERNCAADGEEDAAPMSDQILSEQLDKYGKTLPRILLDILNTPVLYRIPEREQLFEYINATLYDQRNVRPDSKEGSSSLRIDDGVLVQARNLNLRDMVWGGLVGNKRTSYTVAHKADGQRKLLVFHTTGAWLVSGSDAALIDLKIDTSMVGTIFDGELVELSKRTKHVRDKPIGRVPILYYIFDCIAYKDSNKIQQQNYNARLNIARTILASPQVKFITPKVQIHLKDVQQLDSVEEFYAIMRRMFAEQPLLPYEQDGFIFTPVNEEYNPHSDSLPISKRKLSAYPDVCKWKPPEKMTIDFEIHRERGRIMLYSGEKEGKVSLFSGSKFNVFNPETGVDSAAEKTKRLPDGTIVEYEYDMKAKIFRPFKHRTDKNRPNRLEVAVANWDWLHDPITAATMMGESFELVYKFHNRVKRGLYDSALTAIPGQRTLLDIGSGYGGDVSKWQEYARVVAVEYNEKFIPELQRRIDLEGLTSRVRVVHTGGQDTERITREVRDFIGDQVDVVSCMLSLSFFWSDEAMLNALANTIRTNLKPDGLFIYLTVDGYSLQEAFSPAFGTMQRDVLQLGPATYTLVEPNRSVILDLPGTIVGIRQQEWFVYIYDLLNRIKREQLLEQHRATEEKFLNTNEKKYTQLYSYGISFPASGIVPPVSKLPAIVGPIVSKAPAAKAPAGKPPAGKPPAGKPPASGRPLRIPELPRLPVIPPANPKNPATGDDAVQYIRVPWYNVPVVRIASIGDGSCFFHAVLKAYFTKYQENDSYGYRTGFVARLRRDIAYTLQLEDENMIPATPEIIERRKKLGYLSNVYPDDYPNLIYYETVMDGTFPRLYELEKQGFDPTEGDRTVTPFSYSLRGLQTLFNSNSYVGDEVYGYLSHMLNVTIYVMNGYPDNLVNHLDTSNIDPDPDRICVVIVGNGNHYEVVGVHLEDEGYQTVFFPDDPFIIAINKQKTVPHRATEKIPE